MRTFLRRLMSWLTRSRLDAELAEEMRLHLELRRKSLIDQGIDPRDAVLLLSAIGLYGLMACSVTRRTPEIGVRMALGAGRGAVRWMVLGQSLRLVVVGLAVGVAAAVAGTRVIKSMLYGLTATDPMTITAAAVLMTLVCLAAASLPARRASRVDPMIALRLE